MDCSPPGSSVRGVLQARALEGVAVTFSGGSSRVTEPTSLGYSLVTEPTSLGSPRVTEPTSLGSPVLEAGSLLLVLPGKPK